MNSCGPNTSCLLLCSSRSDQDVQGAQEVTQASSRYGQLWPTSVKYLPSILPHFTLAVPWKVNASSKFNNIFFAFLSLLSAIPLWCDAVLRLCLYPLGQNDNQK